jgi:hypothetical protein
MLDLVLETILLEHNNFREGEIFSANQLLDAKSYGFTKWMCSLGG